MSISTGFGTGTYNDLFKSVLIKLFDTTQREALVEHKEVFKTKSVKDYFDREARMAGLGQMSEIADGGTIDLDDPVYDTEKEFTQRRWGHGFRITAGMKKFNRYDLMKKMTKDLSMVMREGKDIEVARVFNNAAATTYASGFDGLALASASHTCLDDASSTYDNYLDAALGHSSLEDARIYFDTLKDDQGQTIVKRPTKLVVNPYLQFTAEELTGSTGQVDTANNNMNVHKGKFSPFVYHRLTAQTSWFLLAFDDADYGAKVFTSKEPDLLITDSPDTSRDTIVTSEQWFTYGFDDARSILVGDT